MLGGILKGSGWLSVGSWVNRLAYFFVLVILARFLSEEDYGVAIAVTVVIGAIDIAGSLGLQTALIQAKDEPSAEEYSVVWTYDNLLNRLLIASVLLALAPQLAAYFGAGERISLFRALAVVPLLSAVENNAVVTTSRRLEFGKRALLDAAKGIGMACAAIPLAIVRGDPWAIVIGFMAGQSLRSGMSYLVDPRVPRIRLDTSIFRKVYTYGKWVLASNIVFKLRQQGDKFAVGGILGPVGLGRFQIGGRIPQMALADAYKSFSGVMLPIYARIHWGSGEHRIEVPRAYTLSVESIMLFGLPFVGFMLLCSEELLGLVFGDKWRGVYPVMIVMSYSAYFNIISGSSHALFRGIGLPHVETVMQGLFVAVMIPMVILLSYMAGIEGAALAVLSAESVVLMVWIYLVIVRYRLLVPSGIMMTAIVSIVYLVAFGVFRYFDPVSLLGEGMARILLAGMWSIAGWGIGLWIIDRADEESVIRVVKTRMGTALRR